MFRDGLLKHLTRFVELAAIEKDLHQRISGVLVFIHDRAIERDEMLIRRQLEATDAIRGFRKAFVLGERVHFENSLGAFGVQLIPPTVRG